LGDWSFGGFDNIIKFRKQIKCRNVILMHGNHDEHIAANRDNVQFWFVNTFPGYREFEVSYHVDPDEKLERKKYKFIASHFPLACWDYLSKGMIHIHGHHHFAPENRFMPGRAMDVGMDGNNYKPYDIRQVYGMLRARPVKSLMDNDHHTEN
jgi:calcineurin-like phosphoesterase family protein